jgi:hypothetical protein
VQIAEGPGTLFDDPLALTGHCLEQFVFHPQNRPLPPARERMISRLSKGAEPI